MTFGHQAEIFDGDAVKTVTAVANGAVSANRPVGIYLDSSGVINCIAVAADSNTVPGRWGVAPEAIADTEEGKIIVKGKATVASGGTADQLITAINTSGVITDAAVANTNADTRVLGVSIDANDIIIY